MRYEYWCYCHYVIVLAVVSVIVTSANTVAIVTASVLSYLLPSFSHTLLYLSSCSTWRCESVHVSTVLPRICSSDSPVRSTAFYYSLHDCFTIQ